MNQVASFLGQVVPGLQIDEKMTGGERVVLLLKLLGREVRVVVPLSATRSV